MRPALSLTHSFTHPFSLSADLSLNLLLSLFLNPSLPTHLLSLLSNFSYAVEYTYLMVKARGIKSNNHKQAAEAWTLLHHFIRDTTEANGWFQRESDPWPSTRRSAAATLDSHRRKHIQRSLEKGFICTSCILDLVNGLTPTSNAFKKVLSLLSLTASFCHRRASRWDAACARVQSALPLAMLCSTPIPNLLAIAVPELKSRCILSHLCISYIRVQVFFDCTLKKLQ